MLRIRICIAAPALAAVRFPTEPVILHRPFAALRTISDRADDAAHVDFMRFIDQVASRYSAAILEAYFESL